MNGELSIWDQRMQDLILSLEVEATILGIALCGSTEVVYDWVWATETISTACELPYCSHNEASFVTMLIISVFGKEVKKGNHLTTAYGNRHLERKNTGISPVWGEREHNPCILPD
jgi:hypothetical protein